MAAMFGHTWSSQYGASPSGEAGDTWATALGGITPAQIAVGLRAVLASGAEWPPSAPRFRAMCLAIPPIAAVQREMLNNGAERSAFCRLVWQYLDGYRWRLASAADGDRILRGAYDLAHDHVMRGGELPAEPFANLSHESDCRVPASPEVARAAMAQAMAALYGPPCNDSAASAAAAMPCPGQAAPDPT